MSDDEKNIMIGDLLVRSGLISSGDLTEAMAVSRRLGMPMGRVLTMDGRISPDIFQLALEAQSIIRDGLVPPDVGIEALAVAARDRQPIHEALKRMDRHPQAKGSTNRLGELLVDADIISTDQLTAALKASVETGLPLGGTLVTQGIIHASLLPTVLRAQEQIRDGILPRDAAIEELKAAMKIWSKAEAAMKRTDYATEQPLKPSSVMSTLRDTLEGPRPQPQQHQHQPQPHPYQQLPPQQVPVHAPPQHQPSQLHAQLQQQQQYFQDQQQHHQQPQGHPMQHQQTQPMQMPPQMPQQMQQPMPQQMQQQMPQQMQQPMPQQMQQPMPPQMPPPMQQPMPQQMPAPIYGYNTPYGHAPYGGPAPDDPWGSWHGSVPRHHGLGVPLPGFPQPPSMPPEGYAPPPGYPQQMPPQGAPPPPNWNMPAQNPPMPPQQMPQPASNLHAQLQQQQQMQHQTPPQPMPQPQPVHQQHAAPVPQHLASPALTPQVQQHHQPETAHNAVSAASEIPSYQAPVSAPSAPAATVPPPPSPSPAPPPAPPLPAAPPVPTLEPVRAEDASKDPGQLKNAAAQLASRLGWAAPKGGDGDAATDLPSPRKLSWGQPKITSLDSSADTAIQESASQQKSEPAQALPGRPEASPLSTPATSTPSSEMRNPFGAPSGSPQGSPTPGSSFPVSKGPELQPEPPNSAFASPPVSETPSTAAPAAPSQDFKPPQVEEVEIPPEKDLQDLVKDAEDEDDDDEPNFKMEFDLELPAPFNKPVEELRSEAAETSEQSERTEKLDTEPKSETKVEVEAEAEAETQAEAKAKSKSEPEPEKVQDKVEQPPKEEQAVPVQAPTPVAEAPSVKPMQKPVGLPISMPISVPIETGRPGHIAGFGKGTKISLKSDYAPSDTGRLFAITPSEALTLLAEDDSDAADDKKEAAPSKGKKGKNKASQSQNKLSKQPAKGKKGQAGKSQTGLQSIKEAEAMPSWTTQKNQAHPATMFGKKGGAGVPDFIEDLVPAAQAGLDASAQIGELMPVGPAGKASNTQSKMASIKQRAVSVSVSNLLPVPLEIAEAQAELAYIVEHRGAPATPVTYTPPPPLPPQPQADATIVELLTMSGFFSKKDIASALEKALEDASMAPDLLMALGLVNDDTLDVVVRCQGLTRSRYLTNEQAIYVLGAVRSGRLSFEEALVEIGK